MAVTPTDLARGSTQEIGRRHGVPSEAVETLVEAIRQGGGQQAQFSHPALGGMGQWSRGGGIMIGDMFNRSLKAKVEQLCEDLARCGEEPSSDDWWPRDLGRPSSVGSQNDEAYAFFPEPRRLALRDANGVRLYETGDHRISGVSQQQGSSRDLVFISQHGMVRPADLQPVQKHLSSDPAPEPPLRAPPVPDARPGHNAEPGVDALALIERLYELQRKGVLTVEEFAAKKSELLSRL